MVVFCLAAAVMVFVGLVFLKNFHTRQKRSLAAMNLFYDFRNLVFEKKFVHGCESLKEWRTLIPCSLYIDWQYRKWRGSLATESSCEYFVLAVLLCLQELPAPIEEPTVTSSA